MYSIKVPERYVSAGAVCFISDWPAEALFPLGLPPPNPHPSCRHVLFPALMPPFTLIQKGMQARQDHQQWQAPQHCLDGTKGHSLVWRVANT